MTAARTTRTTSTSGTTGRRTTSASTALGAALLSAAVAVSASRARTNASGDLDPTVYGVGVAAALVLLYGFGARALVRDPDVLAAAAPWPLALGSLAAGLVVAVGLDGGTATAYVAGAVVLALGAASYALVPSAPPAVAAVAGAFVVYVQGFEDSFSDATLNTSLVPIALAVVVFVVPVTAVAWVLPPARTTVAVVVGAGAVATYTGVVALVAFTRQFQRVDLDAGDGLVPVSHADDVYLTLALAAVLMAGWTVLGHLTDSAGFRVLVVAMAVTLLPVALAALAVDHPTTLALAAGVLGAVVLVVTGVRARTARSGD
ncbi:hypothetical protein [Nocardioides sp.]|uniref:hypothetical protein n=1 Tax=Nocardioides sp. TaxID=35761 RepID=UPI002717454E|nr:hypothetical protein [Nocardioides sp.]MDO9455180.1 hypothetical protein [Nocardioides sp.]